MKDLHLKKFEASSFMGIDSESPIVIEFPKNGKLVTKLTGDMGVGKTSTMTALMYLMGAAFDIDTKNFKNLTDETIDVKMEFEYEKEKYSVVASGTRLVLKKFFKEADNFVSINEPKTVLRKIFGNLGLSPMFLKSIAGKKQIEWFKETFGTDEEATRKEKKIIESIDSVFTQRRDVNRDIKNIKGSLALEPMYLAFEKNQELFKKPISAEKEKEKFEQLAIKKSEYDKAVTGLTQWKEKRKSYSEEMARLEAELKRVHDKHEEANSKVFNGEKWIKENKQIVEEYEEANLAWLNISSTISKQDKWKGVVRKKKELDDMETTSQQADATLDKLRVDLLKLTKSYLPDIPNLEIRVKTGLDDTEEGIYYQGKSLAMLSESEIWNLFEKVWAEKGVQFVFCENVNSLGSDAVAMLNKLVKEGASVFASQMERKQNHMEVSFSTKIE